MHFPNHISVSTTPIQMIQIIDQSCGHQTLTMHVEVHAKDHGSRLIWLHGDFCEIPNLGTQKSPEISNTHSEPP